ncbi:MAG: baseplate J/gp47 family protein [Leptolyngbyaceae cyanobacterium MO_188.B28]|nr:baseplate J/gp47 family protein [Leptolyngbyaceae cyanobacterium MO_188.B28]
MEIKASVLRDGTSQRGRALRSLDPDYISVEERTLVDWIQFVQAYAQDLIFFNLSNQPDGDWSAFFAGDAEAMADAVASLDKGGAEGLDANRVESTSFSADMLRLLAQPHLALFLTCLKLLRYPQQQFNALTQRRLDFYYRQVLRLAEKAATPDQAHVIFSLAPDQTEAVLEKGTRLNAGTDAQGKDLHYAMDNTLYITQAQAASVKTLSVEKIYIDLEVIHLSNDRTHEAFEKVLRWAVGTPNQGDALPTFPDNGPTGTAMDILALNTLFQEIRDYTLEQINEERQQYILNQLCFATIDDFQFCFDVHAREIAKQQGISDIIPPTDLEWRQVYRLVERAYRKKINRDRRTRLKQEHRSDQYSDETTAFLGLWRFALGDPAAADPLPPFPEEQDVNLDVLLTALDGDNAEAAARYIQDSLLLSVTDFRRIMDIQSRFTGDWDAPQWNEVYRLLERAQARKRGFTFPAIGRTEINAICATATADAEPDKPLTLPRFHPFSAQPLTASGTVQSLGAAIASPVLHLQEGEREICLTLACQADTFNRSILEELLAETADLFTVAISTEQGWLSIPSEQLQFQVGDFFLEPPLTDYAQTALAPIYQAPVARFGESHQEELGDEGQYLRFQDGGLYRIDAVLSPTRVQLSPTGFVGPSDGIDQYSSLELGGNSSSLRNAQLSDDKSELGVDRNQFQATDVGQYVVMGDGVIYQITQFANAQRVGVQYWGYVPGTGQTRKYAQIAFNTPPNKSLPELTLVGVAITAEADGDAQFTPKDVGGLIAWVNGAIYQVAGIVSDREASLLPVGRINRRPAPGFPVELYSSSGIYLNSLQFKFSLAAAQPATTAPPAQDGLISFHTPHPIIKISLKEGTSRSHSGASYYQLFKDLCLEKANIQVAVQDLQTLQLRSDRAVLNPKSPFEPFDSSPIAGASFYFVHPEIISKPLDSLSLHLEWMGLPDNFAAHYHAYSNCGLSPQPTVINNQSFQAQLDFLCDRAWFPLAAQPLFNTDGDEETAALSSLATLHYDKTLFAVIPADRFATIPDQPDTDDLWEQTRYFRLELTRPDFQHSLYSLVLNKVALATDESIKALAVYPPYTPKVKRISLDYRASAEIHLRTDSGDTTQKTSGTGGRIFQLHPFGYVDLQQTVAPDSPDSRFFLLPQYEEEGSLFIGLRDLQPPQSLTLLFQLVSGSGNADLTNPKIEWSYLASDRWRPFEKDDVLSDGTNGLVDSGVLHLSIPENATRQNHLLPAELHWLRATVSNHAAAIPDALDIRTQAAIATFVDQNNTPDRLDQPLAADSIQALVERNPAIATVSQPCSSFGGRRQETNRAFYTRVSERLRHKRRAVTRWDYERLVLEQFPQIYKVKCLTQAEQSNDPRAAQVTVVIIPNIANTAPFLPLEPKAPLYLLREIEAYLQSHASPFVRVVVKNPRYEQIKYRAAVRFQPGYEQGYYLKQLNQELVKFLSPWAYEEQSDISFGSSIHSSTVIHFIESRPYVDYVANLKLIEQVALSTDNRPQPNTRYRVNTSNLAQVKQVDSILVSAPNHIIDLITASDYTEESFEGIDYMIVGLDFFVT